jgi:hypothetical protein
MLTSKVALLTVVLGREANQKTKCRQRKRPLSRERRKSLRDTVLNSSLSRRANGDRSRQVKTRRQKAMIAGGAAVILASRAEKDIPVTPRAKTR